MRRSPGVINDYLWLFEEILSLRSGIEYLGWPKFLKLALLALLAHVVTVAHATPMNAKALSGALEFYKPIQEFEVHFQQTKHMHDMDIDLTSEGRLHVRRPNQVVWQIIKPAPVQISIDHDKVEIRTGSGETATSQTISIKDLSHMEAAGTIGAMMPWLTLDAKALAEQYVIDRLAQGGYRFAPKSEQNKMFSRIEAYLRAQGNLEKLILSERSGDLLTIRFDKPTILSRKQ